MIPNSLGWVPIQGKMDYIGSPSLEYTLVADQDLVSHLPVKFPDFLVVPITVSCMIFFTEFTINIPSTIEIEMRKGTHLRPRIIIELNSPRYFRFVRPFRFDNC
jgi:hypothetical protein